MRGGVRRRKARCLEEEEEEKEEKKILHTGGQAHQSNVVQEVLADLKIVVGFRKLTCIWSKWVWEPD